MENLTFKLVDDICLGLQSGILKEEVIPELSAHSIGPLFELVHVLGARTDRMLITHRYGDLLEALTRSVALHFNSRSQQGFISVQDLVSDALAKNDFFLRLTRASQAVGFAKEDAWKLAAAVEELSSNVVEHSENIKTGYAIFSTTSKEIEFVIGDHGIGVLSSLRRSSTYINIASAGHALELALSEGVSRHMENGRGFGFRPIFVGLANISKHLRFRSGDFGRELRRTSNGEISASTSQLASIGGLFCSIVCASGARA